MGNTSAVEWELVLNVDNGVEKDVEKDVSCLIGGMIRRKEIKWYLNASK